jgi:hypothetical protein
MEKYLNMVFLRISSEYRDLHVDQSVLHELPTGFNTPKEAYFQNNARAAPHILRKHLPQRLSRKQHSRRKQRGKTGLKSTKKTKHRSRAGGPITQKNARRWRLTQPRQPTSVTQVEKSKVLSV